VGEPRRHQHVGAQEQRVRDRRESHSDLVADRKPHQGRAAVYRRRPAAMKHQTGRREVGRFLRMPVSTATVEARPTLVRTAPWAIPPRGRTKNTAAPRRQPIRNRRQAGLDARGGRSVCGGRGRISERVLASWCFVCTTMTPGEWTSIHRRDGGPALA
jgi:hypothetical protein